MYLIFIVVLTSNKILGQLIDINCNSENTIDQTVKCIIVATSNNSHDQLITKFHTDSQLQNELIKKNYHGVEVTNEILDFYENKHKLQVILINSEILFDSHMMGFQVFATLGGKFILKYTNHDFCGYTIKCGDYFKSNREYTDRGSIKTIDQFILVQGYNRIIFKNPLFLTKGTLFLIEPSTSKIAIENSFEYPFEDYYIEKNFLYPLNDISNSRFYFNVLIQEEFYQKRILFTKKIKLKSEKQEFNFSTWFLDKEENTKAVDILATNYQHLNLKCEKLAKTRTIVCALLIVSQSNTDEVEVDFGNDTKVTIQNKGNLISNFGMPVSNNYLVNPIYDESYILTNNEVLFDAYLIGFELYVANYGPILLQLIEFESCKYEMSCASYIEENPKLLNYNITHLYRKILSADYHYIKLSERILLKKGQMILHKTLISRGEGLRAGISIDSSGTSIYSDYQVIGEKLVRINKNSNWRFMLNLIIETKYYLTYFYYNVTYQSDKSYNQLVKFSNWEYSLKKTYSFFIETKQIEINCQNSIDNATFDCDIKTISDQEKDVLEIDFGDCDRLEIRIEAKLTNFVGAPILPKDAALIDQNKSPQKFILTSTELPFDSILTGFSLFMLDSVSINIFLVKYETCGLLNSCGNFFQKTKLIDPYKIKFLGTWSFKTKIGLNVFKLNEDLSVSKGSFSIIEVKSNVLAIDDSQVYQDFKMDINGTLFELDPDKKIRFLFNALLKDSFYLYETSLKKFYYHGGFYDITLNLSDSNKIVTKKIYVDKKISLDFICSDALIDSTINCQILFSSLHNLTGENIFIDYGDCSFDSVKASRLEDSQQLTKIAELTCFHNNNNNNKSKKILLLKNELNFNARITGIEINVCVPGKFRILLYSFRDCGNILNCLSFFRITRNMSHFSERFSKIFDLPLGYSRIEFDEPIIASKGLVPVIEYISDGRLYANTNDVLIPDFKITKENLLKIHHHKSSNLIFDFILDRKIFKSKIIVKKKYPMNSYANLTAVLSGHKLSAFFFTKEIQKNGECFFLEKNLTQDFSNKCKTTIPEKEPVQCCSGIKFLNENNTLSYKIIERSELVRFKAIFTIKCNVTSPIIKYWKLKNKNESKEVILDNNPTKFSDELTILSNSLNYGLHQISFFIEFSTEKENYSFSSSTLFKIVPSGILVNGIENQNDKIKIGTNQKLELDPVRYSFDIDRIIEPFKLNFSFFCSIIRADSEIIENVDNHSNFINDRFSLKTKNSTSPCFKSPDNFEFMNGPNHLIIKAGSIKQNSNENYLLTIMTFHLNKMYFKKILVTLIDHLQAPITLIKCRIVEFCVPIRHMKRINPSNQLTVIANCLDGCENVKSVKYEFNLYKNIGNSTNILWEKISLDEEKNFLKGKQLREFSVSSLLFQRYKSTLFWRVDLFTEISVDLVKKANSSTSMILKINEIPFNGTCSVNSTKGFSMATNFFIECKNWIDIDGFIVNYEFFATYANNSNPIALNYNQEGFVVTQLPQGPESDNYQIILFVQIIDDSDAIAYYEIPHKVIVEPKIGLAEELIKEILSKQNNSRLLKDLFESDLQITARNVISLTSILNVQEKLIINSNQFNEKKNDIIDVKKKFIDTTIKLPIGDISSIKVISSTLSVLTENIQEITIESAEKALNKGLLLAEHLLKHSSKSGYQFLKQAINKIIDTATNSLLAIDQNFDNEQSQISEYSTRLKNGYLVTKKIFKYMLQIALEHLSLGENSFIKTKSIHIRYSRSIASKISQKTLIEDLELKVSQPCQILNIFDSDLCNDISITEQVFVLPRSINGINNDSKINLSLSKTIGLSYYGEDKNEIIVDDLKNRISFLIPHKIRTDDLNFDLVSFLNITQTTSNLLMIRGFNLSHGNSIFNLLIKTYSRKSYVVYLRYEEAPILNKTNEIYGEKKIFCPNELFKLESNNFYYQLKSSTFSQEYLNSSLVWIGIREINLKSCFEKNYLRIVDHLTDVQESENFELAAITLGCYYYDQSTGDWVSKGVQIMNNSNLSNTHCVTSHLTEFAGGLVVLPNPIDFEFVFANSSFEKNPTIYLTLIVVCSLYILVGIWCLFMDKKDKQKIGFYFLGQNSPYDSFLYEIIIFTGNRRHAGCDSNIFIELSGDVDTSPVLLKTGDTKSKPFMRSAVDSFILTMDRSLGKLNYCKVFQDCSGLHKSWYLSQILVHDLQTKEKHWFICEKWLALDKQDGKIERILPVAAEKQRQEIKYLIQKQTKSNFSDNHLWFSVVARPTLSSFSRIDRLTCCFVLLLLTMLINILYYDVNKTPKLNSLKIGPFILSPQQISIGVISNLIVFPPSFILIQLFRRSKSKKSRKYGLKNNLKQIKENFFIENKNENINNKSKKFLLPWWFKIIAYILSFIFAAISAFFIVIKGISFGDDQTLKWLTSFVVSIFTSFLLTQPIQVAIVSVIVVFLFRKSSKVDNDDLKDKEDKILPVNSIYKATAKNSKSKFSLIDEAQLNSAKIMLNKKNRLKKLLKETILYFLFIWLLFFVSYSNQDYNSYKYKNSLENLLNTKYCPSDLKNIQSRSKFWSWIFCHVSYIIEDENLIRDKVSYLVGDPILRQLRVQKKPCKANRIYNDGCFSSYDILNELRSDFSYGWQSFNSSKKELSNSAKAFVYRKFDEINSYPYIGQYGTYLGGGYTYIFNLRKHLFLSDLEILKNKNWIDNHTSAVFLEFSTFNPNVNLFSYCIVLFEILPTGNFLNSAFFQPILLNDLKQSLFVNLCGIVYMLWIMFYVIRELKCLVKQKSNYFTKFSVYIEWSLIAFSWAAFAVYLYKLWAREKIRDKLRLGQRINLQILVYWTQLLNILLGFCSLFGTIKFLRLLKFSKKISYPIFTLRKSLRELFLFGIIFSIFWMAFVQLLYLLMNDKSKAFSSLISTFESSFLITLGNMNQDIYTGQNGLLGSFILLLFNLIIVLILVNTFLTIILDNFSEIKNEKKDEDELGELIDATINLIRENKYEKKNQILFEESNFEQTKKTESNILKICEKFD